MLKPALGIIFLHPVFLMFILLIFSNLLSFLAISYFKINSESSEKVILDILLMSYAFLLGFLFKKSEPDEAQSQAEKESTQIYSALFYSLILQSTIFLYLYIFFSENCFIRFSVLNNALWLLFINLVICKKIDKNFYGKRKK